MINAAPDTDATPNADAAPTPTPAPAATQEANRIPDIAPTPRPQPAMRFAKREKADDRDTGGFYAMVIGTDGTREYRYFPSKPSP